MSHQYPPPARTCYLVILLTIAYIFSFLDKYLPVILIGPVRQDPVAPDTRRTSLVASGIALWSQATAVSGLALVRYTQRHYALEARRALALASTRQ